MAPTRKKKPARKKKKSNFRRHLRAFGEWLKAKLRTLVLPVLFLAVIVIGWFFLSLPDIDKLNQKTRVPSVVVKAEDGSVIGSYGDLYGDYVTYDELPQALVDAVLATEDRDFFRHFGLDLFGIARAIIANFRAGSTVQGGSTITQQVAKNVFLTNERSLNRKVREALLAIQLERRYSKEDIFSIYVNRVYLGAGNFGVDAASRRYFGKSARNLNLSESAIIAGLLKAPSRFAPTANPTLARKRAEQVLINMVDAGYLKPAEAESAKKDLAKTVSRIERNTAESSRYYADWIIDQLPDFVGQVDQDLVVDTPMRPAWQKAGEAAIAQVMEEKAEKLGVSQAALVAMTPDGAVRVMIGGRDYGESPFNRAVQAHRQPGSSFKLFVYLAGLENGFRPGSTVIDQPVRVGKWRPRNYTGDYRGEIPLSEAVANSINTVAVQVSQEVGLSKVVAMAHRLGVTSDIQPLPSIALGSTEVTLLEMTGAYAHLAANGESVQPYGILRIRTAEGQTLYERTRPSGGQALSESVVGMMNLMLEGVMTSGTGRGAAIGRPAAGKTGTTSDYRDAWFMGYTPDLAAGVWVGNDDNTPMKKVTGGTLPAPIWRQFMKTALAGTPSHDLPTSTGFWQSLLPWQTGAPEQMPVQQAPALQEPLPPEEEEVYRPERHEAPNARVYHPGAPANTPHAVPQGNIVFVEPRTKAPAPPPQGERDREEFHLGPAFWDKLEDNDGRRPPIAGR